MRLDHLLSREKQGVMVHSLLCDLKSHTKVIENSIKVNKVTKCNTISSSIKNKKKNDGKAMITTPCENKERDQENKSIRRMPWHQEPKKDVTSCEKPRGGAKYLKKRGCPNGETHLTEGQVPLHETTY